MSFDFSPIEAAGISQAQFGTLVGVSRVTVNTWVNGHFSPRDSGVRQRVLKALGLLRQAVDKGRLPVAENHRKQLIEQELSRVCSRLDKIGG